MAISRSDQRAARAPRASALFGAYAAAALDLLELLEFAWHDCYGAVSPPDDIVEDLWVVSDGDLPKLVSAARLAVEDWRDLRLAADAVRAGS